MNKCNFMASKQRKSPLEFVNDLQNFQQKFYQGFWPFLNIMMSLEKDTAFHQLKIDMYWRVIQLFLLKKGPL